VHCKEADALFTAETATSAENGLAIEIAHGNETFPVLCREILNWTSGKGERALLAVGIKLNTEAPYQVWMDRDVFFVLALYNFHFPAGSSTPTRRKRLDALVDFAALQSI
jgi:hypothetical protein